MLAPQPEIKQAPGKIIVSRGLTNDSPSALTNIAGCFALLGLIGILSLLQQIVYAIHHGRTGLESAIDFIHTDGQSFHYFFAFTVIEKMPEDPSGLNLSELRKTATRDQKIEWNAHCDFSDKASYVFLMLFLTCL